MRNDRDLHQTSGMKKADIIGAGIGGLTTAVALEQIGYSSKIYEQAAELKPVGAGILLAGNAMKVFRELGLNKELKSKGVPLNGMNVVDINMRTISKIDLGFVKEKYDLQSVAIHRGALQQTLLDNLKNTEILLDHRLENLTKEEDGYLMNFKNGNSIKPSLLLGADGIDSQVRNAIFPNTEIRGTQQMCWRGVVDFDLPKGYQKEVFEIWGNGSRLGFSQITEKKVYWFAVVNFKDKREISNGKWKAPYKNYPDFIQQLINDTPSNQIHEAEITDLKPIKKWHDEFACLIGDAAHATTPNMGQGACQSIEDAYAIAQSLKEDESPTAFAKYQKSRIAKAHKVVNMSRMIGNIGHWKNPIAIAMRNGMMRMTPASMNRKQIEEMFQ